MPESASCCSMSQEEGHRGFRTGGPCGTLDHVEAGLAPATKTRAPASRVAADRLATLRVESIVSEM